MMNRIHQGKRRVLVVDDDAGLRTMLTAVLADMGCEVVEAEDGGTGLDLIRTQTFSLVITDHEMPERTGVELIRAVLSEPARAHPPMILFTGHALDTAAISELRAEVHGRHAVFFVKKGESFDDLHVVLSMTLAG